MDRIGIEDAVALAAGSRSLFLPGCAGEPKAFLERVERNPGSLAGVSVVTGFVSGLNSFARLADCEATLSGFFPPTGVRALNVALIPSSYYGIDRRIAAIAPEMVVTEIAPPRADGTAALGLAVDFTETALALAVTRLAIVNSALPDLIRSPRVALGEFTHLVEPGSRPLLAVPEQTADDVSREIASRIATLIPDGAVLQIGIGRIPSQVMTALSSHRGLRFHSGIVTSGIRSLVDVGALAEDRPVIAASFGGDATFYEWLRGRREFALAPVRHTHAPATLAALPSLYAINSALEVDLLGQVNAEWVGTRRVSAPGGLPDFAHAAHRARQGCAIIALPATSSDGTQSRIVRSLVAPPTLAAGAVDIIVTEYGTADLRGRTADERATLIAGVAAPSFREALTSASPA